MKENSDTFYFCPRCKNVNIWELNGHIYCPTCLLTFEKRSIQQFLEEEILSNEEKDELIHIFEIERIDFKNLSKFFSE